jgi:8-oxo-dGTP pyrophosphatase MutT (NUDIX family)
MEKMKFRKAVFIVVYSKHNSRTRYLILKRKLHWKGWEFPKGGVKLAETKRMAVRRETKEETGLKILGIKKFNFAGKYKYDKKYSDRRRFIGQTFYLYAVETRGKDARLDKLEHSDFKWMDFNEAMKRLTWEDQRKSLNIVNLWVKTR